MNSKQLASGDVALPLHKRSLFTGWYETIAEKIGFHFQDKKEIRGSLPQFVKGKSYLTSLIVVHEEMIGSVDDGKSVVAVLLDFNEGCWHYVLENFMEKLMKYRLN